MKKLTALWMALCLLLTALPAWAEALPEEEPASEEDAARVAVNLQAIKVMLDDNELEFSYQEDTDTFALEYALEGDAGNATLWLTAYEDGVWVRADYEGKVPEDKWSEIMRFCTLCNEESRIGCFYLDREYQSVGYKQFLYTDVLPPTQKALAWNTALALTMLKYRSAGLAAILHGDAGAEEAFRMTEK